MANDVETILPAVLTCKLHSMWWSYYDPISNCAAVIIETVLVGECKCRFDLSKTHAVHDRDILSDVHQDVQRSLLKTDSKAKDVLSSHNGAVNWHSRALVHQRLPHLWGLHLSSIFINVNQDLLLKIIRSNVHYHHCNIHSSRSTKSWLAGILLNLSFMKSRTYWTNTRRINYISSEIVDFGYVLHHTLPYLLY